MKISDQQLRADRLIFYERDIERLAGELDGFLELSKAKCVLLIDREGHLVTRRGESVTHALESLSALVAGSFAATREMATLLGEPQFSSLFHQGEHSSIQISLVGGRTLMGIVWDDRTNLGLVRFYAQETTKRLEEVFEDMDQRNPADDPGLSSSYSQEAAAALDDLF